jgi:putative transposase
VGCTGKDMPRPLRVEYEGARYHVMCRGNRGAQVFGEPRDKELYLDTLAEAVERTGWRVHAWVLMLTHYHLLIETPEANLVEGMKWFQGTFTQRHNGYHRTYGHLFQGRYKAKLVDDEDPEYFKQVADYIHLNPVAAGLLNGEQPELRRYAWSSFPDYLKSPSKRPGWLRVKEVLFSHGVGRDTAKGRGAFEASMQQGMGWVLENQDKERWRRDWRSYERGWVHGNTQFRERMLAYLAEEGEAGPGPICDGAQRRSYLDGAAEAALGRALVLLGLGTRDLKGLKKGDERKLLVAGWLKKHFCVTNPWLSEHLHMGHPTRVSRAAVFYRSVPRKWKTPKRNLEEMLRGSG